MFNPHITVACVVQTQGEFLVVEELVKGQRLWNQPAGHLEANETLLAAAQRELWEETGIQAQPQSLLQIFQWVAPDNTPFLRFTFVLDLPEKPVTQPQDPEIIGCLWLGAQQIIDSSQLRSPLVRESLRCYQYAPRYPLAILNHFTLPPTPAQATNLSS